MSQPTSVQPPDNEASTNSSPRSLMSSTGTRVAASAVKNRIPANQSTRAHNDATNQPGNEEGSKSRPSSVRGLAARSPGSNTAAVKKPTSAPQTYGSNPALRSARNQYSKKRKDYSTIEKELAAKEKPVQELFNELSELREKIIACGGEDPGPVDEVKILIGPQRERSHTAVSGENTDDGILAQIGRCAIASESIEGLKHQLEEIYSKLHKICEDALDKHAVLTTSVYSWFENQIDTVKKQEDMNGPSIAACVELHQKDNEDLKCHLQQIKLTHDEVEKELVKNISGLYEECQLYCNRLKEVKPEESQREFKDHPEVSAKELLMEREKGREARERLRIAESNLTRARAKIRELETRVASDESKIQEIQNAVASNAKAHELQSKKKDEVIKEMQKTLKNSENLVAKVEKQRDSFESRLMELKEQMNSKEQEALAKIKELIEKVESVAADADAERGKRYLAEKALEELEERYKSIEEKSQQLCELAEKNKEFAPTNGEYTKNEIRLFNELQDTRAAMERLKDKVTQLQQEKEEIITAMQQASNSDDDHTSERLAAQVAWLSQDLQELVAERDQLQSVAKNAQEKSGILERQLQELQDGLRAQLTEDGKSSSNAHIIELQQQISDLRNHLMEALKQKEDLEHILARKQLELEQRDRVMRDQNKLLKVRDELLEIIQGKSQQSEDTSNNEDNSEDNDQITIKREALQELYKTVTNKQLQVMRLEMVVKLMEDQQDRAQAQRTRYESRIAELELALQQNKEQQRSRIFGIL